jgi:signal transduction histidine kinase
MNEFSCRALIGLIEMAKASGIPQEPLLEGHRYPPEHILDEGRRVDWSTGMEILTRVRVWAGTREAFLEIFQRYGKTPSFGYFRKLVAATFSPLDFYRYPNRVVLRMSAGDAIRYTWKKLSARELLCYISTRPDCPASDCYWEANQVTMAKLPNLIGLPDAVVTLESFDPHQATFRVFVPPSGTLWARIGRFLRLHSPGGDPVFDLLNRQHEDLRQSYETLHRTELELLRVADSVREQFARAVHDELGQEIFALKLQAGVAACEAEGKLRSQLHRLEAMAGRVQEMARMIAHGYDPILGAGGRFDDALRLLTGRLDARFDLSDLYEVPTTASRATHLYHIAQEAITNALRHGKANNIRIAVEPGAPHWRLTIEDNGTGFATHATHSGMGLRSMSYRAALLDGRLRLEPGQPGVKVICEFKPEEPT